MRKCPVTRVALRPGPPALGPHHTPVWRTRPAPLPPRPCSDLASQPQNRLLKQLFDFQRVHLASDQAATVSFTVSPATLQLVDKATGDTVSTPGQFAIVLSNGVGNTVVATTVVLSGAEQTCESFPSVPN